MSEAEVVAPAAAGLADRRGRVISGMVVLSLRTTEHLEEASDDTDSPLELYSYAELRPLPPAALSAIRQRSHTMLICIGQSGSMGNISTTFCFARLYFVDNKTAVTSPRQPAF